MRQSIAKTALAVISLLEKAGYESYLVGGTVRDLLLNRPQGDLDLTTNALPEEILQIFPDGFYENKFGTVSLPAKYLLEKFSNNQPTNLPTSREEGENYQSETKKKVSAYQPDTLKPIEITTFRSDGSYVDHRHPEQVVWGKTLTDDLQRRDFTINAIALKINWEQSNLKPETWLKQWVSLPDFVEVDTNLIDPFNGQRDLQQKIIKAVGDPQQRFEEDALRMLRAIRLAAQLEFAIDQNTLVAIQTKSGLLQHISWERIRDEVFKILLTNKIEDAFNLLLATGLLSHIFPELLATKGVEQRGHHEYDVWTHSLRAAQLCPSQDPIVKLAALLHDIAKPETQVEIPDQPGEYSFHNHEVIGARTARDIARRLKLSKNDTQRIFTLVRWHMFYYQPQMTDAAIRRFMRRVGIENLDDIMCLREGDRLGSGSKRTSWRLEEMKQRIQDQLHQPMTVNDLAIDGHDVMTYLNLKPGPKIGKIMHDLFEKVLDDPEKNNRDYLLSQLKKYEGLI